MKILVTDFNREKKIQAIKGVRAVARDSNLKACKDFIDGPLPAELECNPILTWTAIDDALANHGVVAVIHDPNAVFLQFLATLPGDMTVHDLRVTLTALRDFNLPGPTS